jgi:threonine/homoserine/homoserine lactone efflux protein
VVTVSPLNIIPAILLLFTSRPLATATSFLAGFVLGVGVVLGVLVTVAGVIDLSSSSGHGRWGAVLKLVLGAYLLVAAVRKFRGRPRAGAPGSMPGWMDGLAGSTPSRAFGTGAVLGAVNPKNVVVAAAAAATIASGGLPSGEEVAVVAVYVAIAVLGVAAPILATVFLGDRAPEVLHGWNEWLRQNNASVMSVLCLVFGVVLIGQGIAGL